ncbi:GATA transcription factor 29, partial [Mucuna pruriens]
MDFGKTNEAEAFNSKVHDFDLNTAYVEEDFDVNAENEFSSPILINNTDQASQNCIENMVIVDANKDNDEVHQSSEVDTTIEANFAAEGATSEDTKQVEAKYIVSVSFAPVRMSRGRRRRYRHGGEAKLSDSDKFCTNFYCKTRRTPLWRKGPLGPQTLCNACGLQYIKMVSHRGSDLPAAVPHEGDASTTHDDDGASPGCDGSPDETMPGDSNL